jgi:small-conductance mechanosensitive channel
MNYSYPDPRVRVETDLCVGYDSDLEEVRRLIIDTIKSIDGVLDYRRVDALYIEMAPSGVRFRARWWIRSYQETRRNLDQVQSPGTLSSSTSRFVLVIASRLRALTVGLS